MTQWAREDFERCLSCNFSRVDCEPGFEWLEARFSSGGLQFILVIDAMREWIWLRSDPFKPDQATPAFEFTFRSDRIRVLPRGCDSEAVHFEFSDGAIDPSPEHIRLVIERLGSGDLYVWPVLGGADPAHPSVEDNITNANKTVQPSAGDAPV